MHITNVQLVIALLAACNLTVYLLGRRHGRRALRREFIAGPVGALIAGVRPGDR